MKKFLALLSLVLAIIIFVSCESEDEDENSLSDTAADSGKDENTNQADNGETNPADPSNPADPADPSNPTDPETPADPTNPGNPGDPNCKPDCNGKQCGNDGCGGMCGTCGANEICNLNTFICQCEPKCDGKTCGDDGCGGTCQCQNSGDVCNETTRICECVPSCGDKECGNDGCGGTCGICQSGLVCNLTEGRCAPSTCVDSSCDGKFCGNNDCGEPCGISDCGYKQRCSIDQTECLNCSCKDRVCGSDGCGGMCGTGNGSCPDGQTCTLEGQCITCSCEGKKCGDDGCGHPCQIECNKDEMCSADQTQCVKCSEITLSDLVQTNASNPSGKFYEYTAEYTPNGGSSKNHFSLQIYNNPNNVYIDFSRQTFDTCTLDKPTNGDGICAFIKEYTGDLITKLYFPQSGVIHIPTLKNDGSFNDGILVNNPILVEVDRMTGEPVSDGKCYKISGYWFKAKAK